MDIMKEEILNNNQDILKGKNFEVGKNLIKTASKFDPSKIVDLDE